MNLPAPIDPNQRFVYPLEGTALSLFAVSATGGAVSLILVALRTLVRLRRAAFGLDDGLMVAGLVVYIVDVVLACIGASSGLGTRNSQLNPTMQTNALKYLILWMLCYTAALCLVKVSVCITMLRIGAPAIPRLRIALFVLIGLTIATFISTFTGILLLCRPVAANWDASIVAQGRGECSSVQSMLGLSYTSTASTIATDLACAVLPVVILWRAQMSLCNKVLVAVFLSFGSFASISTMIRTPYIDNYNRPADDLAYHIANIPLWSNVETAIGLIAGSLPALRTLFFQGEGIPSNQPDDKVDTNELITIGGTAGSKKSNSKTGRKWDRPQEETGTWERLGDSASTLGHDRGSSIIILQGARRSVW